MMKDLPLWDGTPYPDFVRTLPEIDIPVEGVRGWLLQGANQQVVFFDLPKGLAIPEHSHGEQWGMVIAGKIDLTIGGETKTYGPGDYYHIPAGTPHSALFLERSAAMDYFADADRYVPKK
ncbi:Cupin domain-containing protein [Desulfatibacillum alkenivorans DSM 16219]|uniref:Cupin domain-containing protein n=1 Tax=Desulfatibacillum alkenivorans DSM 16219 TaxID=1121393 RepID=A0A1M6JK32_9BACT|nr:cupin domain-containing protein [Desulfatibacillum alkenivorans]SHJ47111.1 Cupin domain-containing protein [Desulfatibacillum alkenivorans DSM 16219]